MLAIIGTAGKDKTAPMTHKLWESMCADLASRIEPDEVLISGGAAWADHLAVWAFLQGLCKGLMLHLPAPMNNMTYRFEGGYGTAGGTANYYHDRFSKVIGENTRQQICHAAYRTNCDGSFMPEGMNNSAMFARNRKVAQQATGVIAYTWGTDSVADGGTLNTWNQIKCDEGAKIHVSLHSLQH